MAPMLQACPPGPPNGNTCFVGNAVTIPSADATPPTEVVVDFHLPDGTLKTVKSGQAAPTIASATAGTATLIARATDPNGVKDIQLWVAAKSCHMVGNLETCSGPGLLGRPTASNPDNQGAGASGCTERVANQNVPIGGGTSQEVTAIGVNFGGGQTSTTTVTVTAP